MLSWEKKKEATILTISAFLIVIICELKTIHSRTFAPIAQVVFYFNNIWIWMYFFISRKRKKKNFWKNEHNKRKKIQLFIHIHIYWRYAFICYKQKEKIYTKGRCTLLGYLNSFQIAATGMCTFITLQCT